MATGKKLSIIKKYSRSPKAYPSTTLVYNLGKAKHTEVPQIIHSSLKLSFMHL